MLMLPIDIMALTLRLTKEDDEQISFLMAKFGVKTKSKVLKIALRKTFALYDGGGVTA